MDLFSLIGPLVGAGMILMGMVLKHATDLIAQIAYSPPSVCIVFGGTIGALMIAYPMADFISSLKAFGTFIKNPPANRPEILAQIIDLAQTARKESILALEKKRDGLTYAPLRKAVKLAVDGTDPAVLTDTLEAEAHFHMEEAEVAVHFWEDIGALAPSIGILGAVIGLMKVMVSLDQPEKIGPGIMVAFVATFYGVAVANFVGLPVGKKLKRKAHLDHYAFTMVIIGMQGILSGLNPKVIEEKLKIFTGVHGEDEH
ncbi:MAG: MotA/TolQ/ExbB proton channel family protein [Chitinophagaceae bacterium]|nr:MotA/TolQ/ExbB proton channel family protein [Oligoflexus sp.]